MHLVVTGTWPPPVSSPDMFTGPKQRVRQIRRWAEVLKRLAQQHPTRPDDPDLQTQFESLLGVVWRCERMWRLEDRIEHQIEPRAPDTTG